MLQVESCEQSCSNAIYALQRSTCRHTACTTMAQKLGQIDILLVSSPFSFVCSSLPELCFAHLQVQQWQFSFILIAFVFAHIRCCYLFVSSFASVSDTNNKTILLCLFDCEWKHSTNWTIVLLAWTAPLVCICIESNIWLVSQCFE